MDAHTVMEEWDVSPFDGGFDGIRDLQSRRFSGAVEAGTTWLFLRDGDPLAVVADLETAPRPGDVDAFEGASGQAHEAPHPAAASLAAMLSLDGEVRGQYFTEDTPISTVHETLSEGGFTGYIELSENVLSGDYYVVYEDGNEDYLGVLGSSQRLVTDEEAQSKAEGEVGIYNVVAVSYPDVELPEPEPEPSGGVNPGVGVDTSDASDESDIADASSAGTTSPTAAPADDPTDSQSVDAGDGIDDGESPPEPDVDPITEPLADTDTVESDREPDGETEPAPDSTPASESNPGPTTEPVSEPDADTQPEQAREGTDPLADDEPSEPEDEPTPGVTGDGSSGADSESSVIDAVDPSPDAESESNGAASIDDVTARTVPSLDPEKTGRAEDVSAGATGQESEPQETPEPEPEPTTDTTVEVDPGSASESAVERRTEELREKYEARIEELQSELEALREERDRLQGRIASLESDGSTATGGPTLSPTEALAGTSLFVRESTRGDATLEDAHAGAVDRETLSENLRIEYHTQFESEEATVDGEPFESWLRSSTRHEFVKWLVVELLFEIQSTNSASALRPLYDALAEIDRIGFDDTVTVGSGQEGREITFDVVARNRMGEPLVVANIDESREPTRGDTMQPLIGDAEDICQEHESLAGTFAVTSSYFEPDALEIAREATSGSLLSREKFYSYVKLARRNGFHLCLVESREGNFHMTVPEL